MTATPAEVLHRLAEGPSREDRETAAIALLSGVWGIAPETAHARDRLALILEEAWREIRTSRADLVVGLVTVIRADPTPLTLEAAAAALALEGEDGVTELLTLSAHSEFAVRSKVAVGLSLLGRSARWAVPTLIRFLESEPLEYVRGHVIAALGQIGGREALAKLEKLAWDAQGGRRWDLAAEIRASFEQARAADDPETKKGAPEEEGTLALLTNGDRSDVSGDVRDEDDDEREEEEDPWGNVSDADLAQAIDQALTNDADDAPSGTVFRPIRAVSLRSVLLAVLEGNEATQLRAGEWLDTAGIAQTFFRLAGGVSQRVVDCCVSSSMVSGCWSVCEFPLRDRGYLYYSPDEGEHESILGAWEPADDPAARRACILSVYAREWRERLLPPAMGEWATGDSELLQEAILRVLEAEPAAWKDVLQRLEDAPEPRQASAETVERVAKLSAAPPRTVRDVLDLVAGRDHEHVDRLARGLASDEERRAVVALFVHCISKDPLSGPVAQESLKTKPAAVADLPATQALSALAHGLTPADRRAGANALFLLARAVTPASAPLTERLAKVIDEAWHAAKTARADTVAGLAETVRTDPGLLTIEIAAAALALEGEDGVTELLALRGVDDPSVRSKVALALTFLGRSARWAVPTLIRCLEEEPTGFVRGLLIHALGRIGGRDAVAELERLLLDAQGNMDWELADTIKTTLEQASEEPSG